MGQAFNAQSNNGNNNNTLDDFICCKCKSKLLLELIRTKKEILLRCNCFCGTLTTNIKEDMKFIFGNIVCQKNHYPKEFSDVKKYCIKCNNFLCDECSLVHEHENNLIEIKDYILNCRDHTDNREIGYCRKCKKSICDKCIKEGYHFSHEIRYLKDLKDMDDILKVYESNLNKAFNKLNELIKMKYGQKYYIEMTSFYNPQKELSNFEENDQEVILCLKLLKTFLDIYKYKERNNILSYQTIAHIRKHKDFEIIRLKDMESKEVSSSRIISIESDNMNNSNVKEKSNNNIYNNIKNLIINGDKNETLNKKINIYLKIDLKEEEIRNNEINIELDKIINCLSNYQKMIKLKNGNLAACDFSFVDIYKNLEERIKTINEVKTTDFVELDNENICILTESDIKIYKKDILNDYVKIRTINLNQNQIYYKIMNITNNNMAILSYIENEKSYFTLLSYPDYKIQEIKLLDMDYQGDMIQMNNLIIICFGLLDSCTIFLYDINYSSLDSINIESKQTYKKQVRCFKINEDKVLISTIHTGFIFNIKYRQVEVYIKEFRNLDFMQNIGNYMLAGCKDVIFQLNLKTGIMHNKYKFNYNLGNLGKYFVLKYKDIVEIENNQFCLTCESYTICSFNYK